MTSLRVYAKPFISGCNEHIIRKKVRWHPEGITSFRCFSIDTCGAFPNRSFKRKPKSLIRKAAIDKDVPFDLPKYHIYFEEEEWVHLRDMVKKYCPNQQLYYKNKPDVYENEFGELLENNIQQLKITDSKNYSNKEKLPRLTTVKGEFREWCE